MPQGPNGVVRWRMVFGYLFAVAVIVFVAKYLSVNLRQFIDALGSLSPSRLFLAWTLALLVLPLNALGFAAAMRANAPQVRRAPLVAAWMATLLSKYVPVVVGHVVGRGLVVSRFGVTSRNTVLVGIVEQVFSLTLCIGVAALAFLIGAEGFLQLHWLIILFIAVVAISAAIWMSTIWLDREKIACFVLAYFYYACALIPYTFAYLVIVEPEDPIHFVYALFSGTVSGVLAVIVPGGLGVRESVASSFFGQDAVSVVLAGLIATRALIFLAEVAGSILGQLWLNRLKSR